MLGTKVGDTSLVNFMSKDKALIYVQASNKLIRLNIKHCVGKLFSALWGDLPVPHARYATSHDNRSARKFLSTHIMSTHNRHDAV